MIRHVLAAICPDTLRPLNKTEIYRRAARREQIRAEQERITKASEAADPPEQRRQIIDLRELGAACTEIAVACTAMAPVACGYVYVQMATWA